MHNLVRNNMTKNICFLSSGQSRRDGRTFWRMCVSLVSAGYDVTYVVCDREPDDIEHGVRQISSGFSTSNRIRRMLCSRKYLYHKALEVNADIYQIGEPELIPLGLKLKRIGKKIIFDMREDFPHLIFEKDYIPKVLRKTISLMLGNYMNKGLKKFDAIFSVTPDIVEYIKIKWGCNEVHMVTNYPFADKDFKLSFDEYDKRGNVLCYVGNAYRISRQEVTFKALENIFNIKYIIAGNIEKGYKSELVLLPYWEKVDFIDGIKKEELEKLYRRISIGNSLRDFTDTGNPKGSLGVIKIFEYMERALPIICTNVELWKDIVNKYKCGICVNPNNPDEIRNAILYLTEHKKEAYQMGQNGRRAVLEEYNWENQANQYINVIDKISSLKIN
jgi:glycosyltransferase involved in cell wall biosynthesis